MARAVAINLKARINNPASTIAIIWSRITRDGSDEILLYLERQHAFFLDKCFEFVANHTFTHTGRCSCKNEIPDVNGKVCRNISYDLVEIMKHEAGLSRLHQLLIFIQTKVDLFFIFHILINLRNWNLNFFY